MRVRQQHRGYGSFAAPPLGGRGRRGRPGRPSGTGAGSTGAADAVLGRESLWYDDEAAGNADLAEVGARLAVREAAVRDNEWYRMFQAEEAGAAVCGCGLLRHRGRRYAPPWRLPAGADGSGTDMFTELTDRFVDGGAGA